MRKILVLLCILALSSGLPGCLPEENTAPRETQPYPDHVFIGPRNCGDCNSLTGSVLITVVFADEADSAWTDEAISDYKTGLAKATEFLISEAKRYGAELNVSFHYLRSKTGSAVSFNTYEEWSTEALKGAGLPEKEQVIPHLKKTFSVKEAPLLFAVNRGGRAFARTQGIPSGVEYAVLHQGESNYCHELLHMFGARDYYYPDEAEELAKIYFPGSIMNTENGETAVDPLTAYLIGWTDELAPEAKSFLDKTAWITPSHVSSSVRNETRSGYSTVENENGTYTGDLLEGVYHGTGKYVWNNGGKFEGSFEYGSPTQGTLTWDSGHSYTGTFQNWKMHGQGKYTWPSGDWYEGTFVDDAFTGSGTAYWSNGTYYVGEFQNWKMHGKGTCTFPDGQVQSGTWENGEFIG